MKYSNQFALAGLLVTSCSVFGATPAEGWYGGLLGGVSYTPTASVTLFDPLTKTTMTGRLTHSIGGGGGGQIGYRICNFRLEGELYINSSPYTQLKIGNVTIRKHVNPNFLLRMNGSTTVGAGFANAFYDFYDEENDPTWVPYLGLGIGYSRIRNSVNLTIPRANFAGPNLIGNAFSFTTSRTKSTPIGQGIIGISYFYSDFTTLGLDYRYMVTKSLQGNHGGGFTGKTQINALNIVFNHWFNDE